MDIKPIVEAERRRKAAQRQRRLTASMNALYCILGVLVVSYAIGLTLALALALAFG